MVRLSKRTELAKKARTSGCELEVWPGTNFQGDSDWILCWRIPENDSGRTIDLL